MLKRTASEIARDVNITRQAVSKHIKKLRERKLIEIDEYETTLRRQQYCSNEKIYRLTDQGRIHLMNSQYSQRDDLRRLKISPLVDRHNVTFKIRHSATGLLPAGFNKKRNFNNWTPHYGWYGDCYWETTPKHVIVKVKARAGSEDAVWRLIEDKLNVVALFFRQLGWDLAGEADMIYEGKTGVVGLLGNHTYEEGIKADIDSTPEPGTVHTKTEGDADRIVNLAYFIEKNGHHLEALPDEIQMLHAEIKLLRETIADTMNGPARKPEPGPEVH